MDTERVNESDSKKKRGRPNLIDPEFLKFVGSSYRGIKTKRGVYQKIYEHRALQTLEFQKDGEIVKNHPLKWLCDYENEGRRGAIKSSVLAELGRIEDKADMLHQASEICKIKPSAHEAISRIREFRTGKNPNGSVVNLHYALVKVINSYLGKHGNATHQMVLDALEITRVSCEKMKEL